MRDRLTKRVAADAVGDKGTGIMNDPYQVNNPEHEKNDPAIGEYAKGDPSAWGEDVNKNLPGGAKDKRDPDTHIPEMSTKMAAEAIQAARKLEEKAVKCIVASQRILPGAADTVIENQAADLMHLPDNMVDSLLSRQEELATTIAKAAADTSEKAKGDDESEDASDDKDAACKGEACEDSEDASEKDAGKVPPQFAENIAKMKAKAKGDKPAEEKKEEGKEEEKEEEEGEKKEVDAKKKDEKKEEKKDEEKKDEKKKEDKDAAKKEDDEESEDASDKDAAKKEDDEESEDASEKDAKKKEDDEESEDASEKEVEASANLLDDIFSGVIASDTKKGAKSLSGLVKKEASESNSDPLAGIWKTDPDVTQYFQ